MEHSGFHRNHRPGITAPKAIPDDTSIPSESGSTKAQAAANHNASEAALIEAFQAYLNQDFTPDATPAPLDLGEIPASWRAVAESLQKHTDRLREREALTRRELDILKHANLQMSRTRDLLRNMAVESTSAVVVVDTQKREPILLTEAAEHFQNEHPRLAKEILWTLVSHSDNITEQQVKWKCSFLSEGTKPRPIRLSVTSRAIQYDGQRAVSHMISDDTQNMEEEQKMEELVYRDPLTGLYNRRYGMMYAEKLVAEHTPFCLAFIDLDNLKFSNDTYGHATGDDYIMSVVEKLRALPQPRVVCRIGGDEFLVIASNQNVHDIIALLKHMNHDMLKHLSSKSSLPYRSLSYGVVQVPKNPSKLLNSYLAEADSIMYARKQRHKVYMKAKSAEGAHPMRLDRRHRRAVNVPSDEEAPAR